METVGVLVVAYGARETAIIDALSRSASYKVRMYIADKQKNPFNLQKAAEHVVIPDLNIDEIYKFTKKYKDEIDFGVVGPEKPIIDGIRDLIEKETSIPIICPTKEYAIEKSKIAQRQLFQKVAPETNPRFKVFYPQKFHTEEAVKRELFRWLDELDNQVAVKPDTPAAGKGVGVWGDHFSTREELFDHFLANFKQGAVIAEEKVEGEESSFQAFCDGKHLVPLPETRDYKRAFDDDKGPNTGGMGSYKDVGDVLPFMTGQNREAEVQIVNRIFQEMKGITARNTALLGVPFYVAFIHTKDGPKTLENNSRPGDPEIINILPLLKDDFVDVCLRMIEGSLTKVELEKQTSVVTYKVPPTYGGYMRVFKDRVRRNEIDTPVDLNEAQKLTAKYGDNIRVYPAAMESKDNQVFALRSRAVCVVGIEDDVQAAREISLEGINAIKGGGLWNRSDIASKEHINKSVQHMRRLRGKRVD
jgi:phosphoribosylamine--glycine ligase